MARAIIDAEGRTVREGDPDFDKVRIDNLEGTVSELVAAVGALQHRLSRVDGEGLPWPGDTYEPRNTTPL